VDAAFSAQGGARVLQRLAEVVPAARLAVATDAGGAAGRMRALAIQRIELPLSPPQARSLLGAKRRHTAVQPIETADEANALIGCIAALATGRPVPVKDEILAGSRLEVDLLRRLLGS
jgi:hypothetical protein